MGADRFFHKARQNNEGHGAPQRDASSGTDDAEAFIAQARWLLEWHNKRSDGFESRAVAILGFSGVIFALLAAGVDLPKGLKLTWGIKDALFLVAALLLITVVCCISVLQPRSSVAPQIEQLRDQWRRQSEGLVRGKARQNIAESLLHGTQAEGSGPLERSMAEATARGHRCALALYFMLASLFALATVVVQLFWQL
jgi:hypothetical protein